MACNSSQQQDLSSSISNMFLCALEIGHNPAPPASWDLIFISLQERERQFLSNQRKCQWKIKHCFTNLTFFVIIVADYFCK